METIIGVKFKPVGKIFYYHNNQISLNDGDGILAETERGLEYGEVILNEKPISIEGELPKILRKVTDKDYEILEINSKRAIEFSKEAKKLIAKLGLEMKLIDCELTFDASKVIFTFTAEGRVDFRELVKELANKLKLRIELKQVGARDESKIIGGLGPCGRAVCCVNHMREFNKVSIKMAKTQGLALNPSKINGLCNRLMCCLEFENEYYTEASKEMPKINKKVLTPDGEGIVLYNNLLKKLVTVRFTTEDGVVSTKEYPNLEVKRLYVEEETENKCDNCPKKGANETDEDEE